DVESEAVRERELSVESGETVTQSNSLSAAVTDCPQNSSCTDDRLQTGANSALHLCSRSKKRALKRQARVEQLTPEDLHDPWVRISDSPPGPGDPQHNLSSNHLSPHRIHTHSHYVSTHTPLQPNTHRNDTHITVAMSEPRDFGELAEHNGTTVLSDQTAHSTPPSLTSTPSSGPDSPGVKKGPPVAPKPAWTRQSLRSIRNGRSQPEHTKPLDKRGAGTNFGVSLRSTSTTQSLKQKIHSFETFSGSEGQEKFAHSRRPVAPSTSLPLKDRVKSNPFISEHNGMVQPDTSKEAKGTSPIPDKEKNMGFLSSAPVASPLSTRPSSTTHPSQSTWASPPPTDDLGSECQAQVKETTDPKTDNCDSKSPEDTAEPIVPEASLPETESETKPLDEPVETSVYLSSPLPGMSSPPESTENRDEDVTYTPARGEQTSQEMPSLTPSSSSFLDESTSARGLEGESLGKILSFSNQVSHALMRSLHSLVPPTPCHVVLRNPGSGPSHGPSPAHSTEEPDRTGNSSHSANSESNENSFSVSLAELRECTIERGEEGGNTGQHPSPSASAQSVISAIPSQEIHDMIQEVKALDEETLKQFEDIHVVILHKDEGAGLGFSIAGGIDLETKATTVHRVFPHGLAAQEGTVGKGDEVLSINGQTLKGVTHADATAALRQARNMRLAVVVVSKGREEKGGAGGGADDSSINSSIVDLNPTVEDGGSFLTLELEIGGGGVGFSLEGGKGSINGDKPLVVNRIFKGGAAEQSGLQSGDELLQVQSTSLQELSRFEAWNIVKALPEGHVTLLIRRRRCDKAEGSV
ncbi:hypothetical protein DPEC_G00252610, partial [Dallia pectoralis]